MTTTEIISQASGLRQRCRNPRCRMKLPAPVENEHHAFCTSGCHASFYRSRCLVCEEPMRRKRERQRLKSGHRRCEAEYRKFPRVYDYPRDEPAQKGGIGPFADESLAEAHSTGLKIGLEDDRPPHRALRHWSWHSDELEHELRDADGTLLARIESNGRRHRLTHPHTTPILSWPDLDEAKRRAEAIALAHLKLLGGVNIAPTELARINATNTRPHPMGPPLNQQLSHELAIASDWRPTGSGAGPDIPDFLRRARQ